MHLQLFVYQLQKQDLQIKHVETCLICTNTKFHTKSMDKFLLFIKRQDLHKHFQFINQI